MKQTFSKIALLALIVLSASPNFAKGEGSQMTDYSCTQKATSTVGKEYVADPIPGASPIPTPVSVGSGK